MKIKLLVVEYTYTYRDYAEDLYQNTIKPLSEWIEVSDEEYILLNDETVKIAILDKLIPKYARNYNQSLVIFTDVTPTTKEELINSIDDILKEVKAKKEQDAKRKKLAAEKQKKLELERKQKAEKKKLEKARKILAEAGEL